MGWDGTGMNCYEMVWDRKICHMDKPVKYVRKYMLHWGTVPGICTLKSFEKNSGVFREKGKVPKHMLNNFSDFFSENSNFSGF